MLNLLALYFPKHAHEQKMIWDFLRIFLFFSYCFSLENDNVNYSHWMGSIKLPIFVSDHVHCFHWLCLFHMTVHLFPGWLHSRSSTRGDPTTGQISINRSTGGGRVAVSPLPVLITTWGIYIIAAHTSDYSLLLQELCKSDFPFLSQNCPYEIFVCCVGDTEVLAWAFAIKLVTALRLISWLLQCSLQSVIVSFWMPGSSGAPCPFLLYFIPSFACCTIHSSCCTFLTEHCSNYIFY